MSDSEDLEEINRQLAELEADLDDEELDMDDYGSDIELEEEEKMKEEEKNVEVEAKIAVLVDGLTGADLIKVLRNSITKEVLEKDKYLQQVIEKEDEYAILKEEKLGQKDSAVVDLELEIDVLNDELEDEERESANMYTVLKKTEADLKLLRTKHSRRVEMNEERQNSHKETMKQLENSIAKSREQCDVHRKTLMDTVNSLSENVYKLQMENEELEEEKLDKELIVEKLLSQQSEKERSVQSESHNVSQLLESQREELNSLEKELETLTCDTEALVESNKQKRSCVDVLTKEYREFNRKHNKVTIEYDDAERQNQRSDREIARQVSQIERLEKEIETLRQERREVLAKLAEV